MGRLVGHTRIIHQAWVVVERHAGSDWTARVLIDDVKRPEVYFNNQRHFDDGATIAILAASHLLDNEYPLF